MKNLIILLVLVQFVVSCSKDESAKGALLEFINYRFKGNQARDILVEKSHGKLKNLLTKMADEEFKKFAKVENLKKRKFKIILENCQEKLCYITYTLNYADYETDKKNKEKYEIEVKKIAKLEKIEDIWLVSDINNIKTYIDSKQKVDVEGVKLK